MTVDNQVKDIVHLRLLIVDDEPDLQELLSGQAAQLKIEIGGSEAEIEILTASNGVEALQCVESKAPVDAVLSDISMPKMNGLEFLAELRKRGYETPVIFLTGFGDKEKAIEAMRLGAMDFLDKPWKPELIDRSLANALTFGYRLRGFQQELAELMSQHLNSPAEALNKILESHRALLLMRYHREALQAKKG